MGRIKIVSDGTLAGTSVTDVDTLAAIAGVRGVTFSFDTVNGQRILVAHIKVRRPIVDIEIDGVMEIE